MTKKIPHKNDRRARLQAIMTGINIAVNDIHLSDIEKETLLALHERCRIEYDNATEADANSENLKTEGSQFTTCTICGVKLHKKNLEKHKDKVHTARSSYKNKKSSELSPSDRKKRLNHLLGHEPDDKIKGKDIYTKGEKLNGGAYGLGKNRKH
ncbi:MAG: hypothetical protein LAT80_15330 [Balneolaceae bacterium]|nr:hypothetical protein [Balneolaceae bacterium]